MTITSDRDQPWSARATDWWRTAVVYQIYPRSFADLNGDGIGDLPGVTSRVGYLAALGVDAVWLSPFYPSQLADGGYDVDDYRDVDTRLGTLADFDEMVAVLHDAGIKVIVDIVPNHTSNRHPWFAAALVAGPGSAERDRYIFREGRGSDGAEPPNDWESGFGGSAWQRVADGSWFFHYFAAEQPDLNWTTTTSERTSARPCDSGPTVASTASGSTSRTVSARTCPSPSRRGARSRT